MNDRQEDLQEDLQELLDRARDAMAQAYAPYSKFPVGAAIRTQSGRIFTGCNVENAAYPVGTCAEAGAIASMIVAGEKRIKDLVVIGNGGMVTPCGACRQRINEFGDNATRIHCAGSTGLQHSFHLNELLPEAFGPKDVLGGST